MCFFLMICPKLISNMGSETEWGLEMVKREIGPSTGQLLS